MDFVRTDVAEERLISIFMAERISKVGTKNSQQVLLVSTAYSFPTSLILSTLKMEATPASETSVLMKLKRHITEDGILHSHHKENLKSFKLSKK
jgi:hypothetical protein